MAIPVIADQFRGLPMGDLIGAPLNAACDAQVALANATANFVKVVGFLPPTEDAQKKDPNAVGAVRTANFKFSRPGAPTPDGTATTEDVEMNVPLLSIVNVPALSVKKVDITFDMEVKAAESSKETSDNSTTVDANASVGWGWFSAKVNVKGSVATHKENARSSDQSAKYTVAVHAADTGMPEGLARVLDIMNQAIAPTSVGKPVAVEPKTVEAAAK